MSSADTTFSVATESRAFRFMRGIMKRSEGISVSANREAQEIIDKVDSPLQAKESVPVDASSLSPHHSPQAAELQPTDRSLHLGFDDLGNPPHKSRKYTPAERDGWLEDRQSRNLFKPHQLTYLANRDSATDKGPGR